VGGTHPEHEDFPWTIAVVDHAPRKETAEYIASRKLMHQIIDQVPDWVLAPGPYEDHHGGSLWVKDDQGWLLMQLPLGIEWSAQFCADPAKVDKLRVMAARIVKAFPDTIPAYEELGYTAGRALLDTPITTAEQVSRWTDSIFNASMPMPRSAHTGVFPHGAGYHHYPKPIVDIDHFRRDDFTLFVNDGGFPAVVVPVSADAKDRRVRLLAANPNSAHAQLLLKEPRHPVPEVVTTAGAEPESVPAPGQRTFPQAEPQTPTILPATDDLAKQAFGLTDPGATDPLGRDNGGQGH
jgi:hypothetical protein